MGRTSRSDVIKKGLERAPHRAFLRAMGLTTHSGGVRWLQDLVDGE